MRIVQMNYDVLTMVWYYFTVLSGNNPTHSQPRVKDEGVAGRLQGKRFHDDRGKWRKRCR